MKNILIIGAGQIGSRHLQALKKVNFHLNILVIDPSSASLEQAKERYDAFDGGKFEHKIEYQTSVPSGRHIFDIAIVASSSDVRRKITEILLKKHGVKYLILEKILFQKRSDYEQISKLLKNTKTRCWVNCPMRMMPFYGGIKKHKPEKIISYSVSGGNYGLVTSTIHHLDHIVYLTGDESFQISSELLDKDPVPSKRKGFLEITGTLTAKFSKGTIAVFSSYKTPGLPLIIKIDTEHFRYIIKESEGEVLIFSSDKNEWKNEKIDIPYQSQMTTGLVEELLKTGTCRLVSYDVSAETHVQFLEPLRRFLNIAAKKKYNYYPFT